MFSLFFFKQKTAYEMRISDWSSDVCSSDLQCRWQARAPSPSLPVCAISSLGKPSVEIERLQPLPLVIKFWGQVFERRGEHNCLYGALLVQRNLCFVADRKSTRLELQSLMRISYAVFCLKKKKKNKYKSL